VQPGPEVELNTADLFPGPKVALSRRDYGRLNATLGDLRKIWGKWEATYGDLRRFKAI
jgi:hypothetical protein